MNRYTHILTLFFFSVCECRRFIDGCGLSIYSIHVADLYSYWLGGPAWWSSLCQYILQSFCWGMSLGYYLNLATFLPCSLNWLLNVYFLIFSSSEQYWLILVHHMSWRFVCSRYNDNVRFCAALHAPDAIICPASGHFSIASFHRYDR